jgi:hypothetical protein
MRAGLQEQIRQVLLTRNRGIPGEMYLIGCDNAYFRQEVSDVRARAFERNVQLLRGLYGPSTPSYATGMTLVRAGVLTARAAADDIASGRLTADAGRWIEEHQTDVIVAVAVIVVLTAAVLVVVATAGAAAPLAIPLAETALIEAGVLAGEEALIASAATAVTVDSTVVTIGATGAAGASGGGAAVGGSGAGVGLAIDGGGLAQGQLVALRFGIGMRQAQAVAALATVATPSVASAALDDKVLLAKPGSGEQEVATQQLAANVQAAALAADRDEKQRNLLLRTVSPPESVLQWRDATIKAGASVAALSCSQLITSGVTSKPSLAGTSQTSRATAVIEIGHLHLLKLRVPKTGVPQLPAPEQEFDCKSLSEDYDGRLIYVGFLQCD